MDMRGRSSFSKRGSELGFPVTVLGIAASPRRGGNSDLLLERALEGVAQASAKVERIIAARLKIGPCIACDGCWKAGRCVVQDEYQMVYLKLLAVERIILASPIYTKENACHCVLSCRGKRGVVE